MLPANHLARKQQRDLWVSCWRVANLQEQLHSPNALATWQKAYDTLKAMVDNNLFVSPKDMPFLDQLRAKVQR